MIGVAAPAQRADADVARHATVGVVIVAVIGDAWTLPRAELGEQDLMESLPDAGLAPLGLATSWRPLRAPASGRVSGVTPIGVCQQDVPVLQSQSE